MEVKASYLEGLTEDFAVRTVRLYDYLRHQRKEYVLSKQIVRSGTSIGANYAESQGAQSAADYVTKLHISLKESKESGFWLNVLYKCGYLQEPEYRSLKNDLNLIIAILIKILKQAKT